MGTTDGFDDFWGDDGGWSSSRDDARPASGARREHGATRGAPRGSRGDITGRIARIFDPSDGIGRRRHGDRNDPQWTQEIPAVDADATPVDDRPDPLSADRIDRRLDDGLDDRFDDVDVWATTARPEQPGTSDETHAAGELGDATADGRTHDDEWDLAAWDVQPVAERRRRGVDPLLAKLGVLAVVLTLATPLFLSLRSGADESTLETAAQTAVTEPVSTVVSTATEVDAEPAAIDAATPSPSTAAPPAAEAPAVDTVRSEELASSTADGTATTIEATTRRAEPTTTVGQLCAIDYEVVEGDFWLRLADGAGVPIDELLEANAASPDTPLFPGATICLPAGSSTPPAPTTAPPPSAAPDTTEPARTNPPTTAAPTTATPAPATTEASTTTAPADSPSTPSGSPGRNASPEQVKQIIRDIWPDELEERAIEIAWRESNWIPTADNGWCCHGVFQIYWTVHQGWLADFGITSLDQLYDPVLNTRAALEIYNRAGGWGPWGF